MSMGVTKGIVSKVNICLQFGIKRDAFLTTKNEEDLHI